MIFFFIISNKLLNSSEAHGCVFGQNTDIDSQSTNKVFRRYNWDISHPDQAKSIQGQVLTLMWTDLQAAWDPRLQLYLWCQYCI